MNTYGRSAQEQREYDKLRYPGADVLINKFDLRDPVLLEIAERRAAVERLSEGLPPEAREISVSGIKAIHFHLFRDVYDWAGEFRSYTSGRGQAPFARPEFIERSLEALTDRLRSENQLRGQPPDVFAKKAAGSVNELNAVHPFVEGNGRTQRVWLRNLCQEAGYDLQLLRGDRDAWNRASEIGFYRSDEPMADLLSARLSPIRDRDRTSSEILMTPTGERDKKLIESYEKTPEPSPSPERSRDDDHEPER